MKAMVEIIAAGIARVLYRSDGYAKMRVAAPGVNICYTMSLRLIEHVRKKPAGSEWANTKLRPGSAESELIDDGMQEECQAVERRSKHKK
jgi:hypothetical protein